MRRLRQLIELKIGPRIEQAIEQFMGPFLLLVFGIAAVIAFGARLAQAYQVNRDLAAGAPCALLENFSGSVQIMESSRTSLIEAAPQAPIPCGGWISVGKGHAELLHRDGFRIHLSSGAFAQLPDGNLDGKSKGDSLILFKGQALGKSFNGSPDLNILTANSRARLHEASAIVVYDESEELTQLIALQGAPSFENRFQASRKVQLHSGEASELNFRSLRVVPSLPRAISYASLKPKLQELKVSERDQSYALKKATERSERKFASVESVRKPAGMEFHRAGSSPEHSPERLEEAAEKEARMLKEHFAQGLTGGQEVDHGVFFPEKARQRRGPVSIQVEDPAEKLNRAAHVAEDREKKKLIEELSQIHLE